MGVLDGVHHPQQSPSRAMDDHHSSGALSSFAQDLPPDAAAVNVRENHRRSKPVLVVLPFKTRPTVIVDQKSTFKTVLNCRDL